MEAIAIQPQVQTQPAQSPQTPQLPNQGIQTGLTMQAILSGAITPQQAMNGGGDFLAMMLQQLMGVDGTMQEMLPEGEDLKALQEQLEQDGAMQGMEMLAAMLMAGQTVRPVDTAELLGTDPLTSGLTQMNVMATGGNAVNLLDILAAGQGKTPMQLLTGNQSVQDQAAVTPEQSLADALISVQHNVGANPSQDQMSQGFSGEAQFRQAVMQAQKLMQKEPQQAVILPVDVDQLQHKVDANKAASGVMQTAVPIQTGETAKLAEAQMPDAQPLMEQVKTGISAGLEAGKNEFVIKLKPDGLGEITVKLVEIGSRMSLSITTSSAQVQRMISSEMAGLREVMKPLGVEVQQVVSQESGHFHADQQGNFGGHQHQQFQEDPRQAENFYWRGDATEEELPSAMPWVQSPGVNASLNAYI